MKHNATTVPHAQMHFKMDFLWDFLKGMESSFIIKIGIFKWLVGDVFIHHFRRSLCRTVYYWRLLMIITRMTFFGYIERMYFVIEDSRKKCTERMCVEVSLEVAREHLPTKLVNILKKAHLKSTRKRRRCRHNWSMWTNRRRVSIVVSGDLSILYSYFYEK